MTIKKAKATAPSSVAYKPAPVFVGQSEIEAPPLQAGQQDDHEPDLVTAIFDLLAETHPAVSEDRMALESAVRSHFRGMRGTVTERPDASTTARRVLALFNGRNSREVARKLRISRGHVYRVIKQAGRSGAA